MSRPPASFEEALDTAIASVGPPAIDAAPARVPASQRRRRGVRADDFSGLAELTLIDDEGMLRWVYEPPPRVSGGRRRRSAVPSIDGVPIRSIPIQDLPTNRVLESIGDLDLRLTPDRGLRVWRNGRLEPAAGLQVRKGRVLLLVHGTFSKSAMFFEELKATAPGRKYLDDAQAQYEAVLAFDHATLSVSPWINALDLEQELGGIQAPIDVVCHSRGGLVVAWWLRLARRSVDKVLFVGSPLAGTTLASPAALRQALDHLATAAKAIALASGAASTVVPLMSVVTGLAQALGKVLQLGADLPLADVAVVSVPGLASQSRVRNNAEMVRLFSGPWPSSPECHAVIGNFRPVESDAGWRFWQRLTHVKDQLKYGAVGLVFDGPNDLVVDTGSMFGPIPGDTAGPGLAALMNLEFPTTRVTQFENSPTVHHTNYFRQARTIDAMRALF